MYAPATHTPCHTCSPCHASPPATHAPPAMHAPPQTEFLTHACENITFSQLLSRTVKIRMFLTTSLYLTAIEQTISLLVSFNHLWFVCFCFPYCEVGRRRFTQLYWNVCCTQTNSLFVNLGKISAVTKLTCEWLIDHCSKNVTLFC